MKLLLVDNDRYWIEMLNGWLKTSTESKLLHLLAINANQVCTADQIVTYVWGYHGDASLIKAHIHHLRQKIEPVLDTPRFIDTVPGVGFKLVPSPAKELAS